MTPFRVCGDDDECGGEIVVSVKNLELPHAYISVAVRKTEHKITLCCIPICKSLFQFLSFHGWSSV